MTGTSKIAPIETRKSFTLRNVSPRPLHPSLLYPSTTYRHSAPPHPHPAMSRSSLENVRLFPGIGPLLAFVYVACLSYSELLVTVTPRLDAATFVWVGVACYAAIIVPVVVYSRQNPLAPGWRDVTLLLLAGASDLFCHAFVVIAVMMAPLGDVITIWSTSVLMVAAVEGAGWAWRRIFGRGGGAGPWCWRHVVLRFLFVVMAIVGVVLITRPSFVFADISTTTMTTTTTTTTAPTTVFPRTLMGSTNSVHKLSTNSVTTGYACAMGNAVALTACYIIVGQLSHVRWAIIEFYFVPAALLVLPPLTYLYNGFRFPGAALAQDYGAAIVSGVIDVLGAVFCTLSLKVSTATTVTLVSTLEIPFGYFLDFLFNGTVPTWSTMGGAALVMGAVVGATIIEIFQEMRNDGEEEEEEEEEDEVFEVPRKVGRANSLSLRQKNLNPTANRRYEDKRGYENLP